MNNTSNIANLLGMARTAELGGNNEEALNYYNRVLEIDPTITDAWLGKGRAAAWSSSLAKIRLPEAAIAFSHAIANAPLEEKELVASEATVATNAIVVALYSLAREHMLEYVSLPQTWPDYIDRVSQLLDGLDQAERWTPNDRATLENIIYLCKDNVEGVAYRDPYDQNISKAWHLAPQYEQLLKERLESASSKIRLADPTYVAPEVEKKQADACFVITATFGDFDHPTVTFLRGFRDQWLLVRPWGKYAIKMYYRYGPRVADFIGRSTFRRTLSYHIVVRPAEKIAKILMS